MRTLILVAISASMLLCVFLGIYSYSRARAKGRYYSLASLFAGAALFTASYAIELVQTDVEGIMRFLPYEYIGILLLVVSMVFVIREFKGAGRDNPILVIAAAIIPLVTVILAFTSDWHRILYVETEFEIVYELMIFKPRYGIWYYIHITYVYAIFTYCMYVFAKALRSGNASRRSHAAFMLVGTVMPLAANILYSFGLSPASIDLTPLAFVLSGVFFATGFFKYRLFDLHPIARDSVFEHMRDPAIVVGEEGAVLDHNAAAAAILPALRSGNGDPRLVDLLDECPELAGAFSGDDGRHAVTLILPTGEERRYETHRSRLIGRDRRRVGSILLLYDVTERERLSRQLRELASVDELTRIRNRRSFYEFAGIELERARRHGRAIGFAVMDMNGFKAINDRFGHAAGDEALRLAARLCSDALRSGDVIGRIGGDEFAFVFPECDEAGAATAADKLRKVVAAGTFSVGSTTIRLSASFGSVGSPGPVHPDLEELLSTADRRMYLDKRNDRAKPPAAAGKSSPAPGAPPRRKAKPASGR